MRAGSGKDRMCRAVGKNWAFDVSETKEPIAAKEDKIPSNEIQMLLLCDEGYYRSSF